MDFTITKRWNYWDLASVILFDVDDLSPFFISFFSLFFSYEPNARIGSLISFLSEGFSVFLRILS